jgi:hypothetical protein
VPTAIAGVKIHVRAPGDPWELDTIVAVEDAFGSVEHVISVDGGDGAKTPTMKLERKPIHRRSRRSTPAHDHCV